MQGQDQLLLAYLVFPAVNTELIYQVAVSTADSFADTRITISLLTVDSGSPGALKGFDDRLALPRHPSL